MKKMKKLFLSCVVVLCTMNSYAQMWDNAKPDKRVTLGVRAGVNCSTWHLGDDYFEAKSKWGLYGGLNIDYNIVKSFAIETGLFFSEKGPKMDYFHWKSYNEFKTWKFSYAQIPVFALYRLPFSEDLHLQVKAGGFVGLCVDHPAYYNAHGDVDAGIAFGFGLSFKKFYIGTQYELGLTELDDYVESKSRNLTISIGYDF